MNEPIAAVGVCGDVATAAGDDVADDDAVAADDDDIVSDGSKMPLEPDIHLSQTKSSQETV